MKVKFKMGVLHSCSMCGGYRVGSHCENFKVQKKNLNRPTDPAIYSINPLKVCHTKIDRMRSMDVCPLNSVVCRRMATKLPRKLPNASLYTKLKSFRGVHIQLFAEIGG